MTDERKRFEEWVESMDICVGRYTEAGGGYYMHDETDDAWQAWRAALNRPGYVWVPMEPSAALLESMAMRYRHDFGLEKAPDHYLFQSGVTREERAAVLSKMRQIHEEVVGTGFYRDAHQQREGENDVGN